MSDSSADESSGVPMLHLASVLALLRTLGDELTQRTPGGRAASNQVPHLAGRMWPDR